MRTPRNEFAIQLGNVMDLNPATCCSVERLGPSLCVDIDISKVADAAAKAVFTLAKAYKNGDGMQVYVERGWLKMNLCVGYSVVEGIKLNRLEDIHFSIKAAEAILAQAKRDVEEDAAFNSKPTLDGGG